MASYSTTAQPPRRTRKTRFVCISDTHNDTVQLPAGDVLIHCGDLSNTGGLEELGSQVQWLAAAPHECKIVIAGNHDVTLDSAFYAEYGRYFHAPGTQSSATCQQLFTAATSLIYLVHEARTIKLTSPSGPRTTFNIFGSPHTPQFALWGFMYPRFGGSDANSSNEREDEFDAPSTCLWAEVPLDTDVLVTHGPARTHLDTTVRNDDAGCEALRRAMWRVRPRLALCGHIHEARGVERVQWDLSSSGTRYLEGARKRWADPGAAADDPSVLSLVDLTATGEDPLRNDGSRVGDWPAPAAFTSSSTATSATAGAAAGKARQMENRAGLERAAAPGLGTRGLGGDPASARSDQEALQGRLGRQESCLINCAIQSTAFVGSGHFKLNKPIVVDLDLPVWEDDGGDGSEDITMEDI